MATTIKNPVIEKPIEKKKMLKAAALLVAAGIVIVAAIVGIKHFRQTSATSKTLRAMYVAPAVPTQTFSSPAPETKKETTPVTKKAPVKKASSQ